MRRGLFVLLVFSAAGLVLSAGINVVIIEPGPGQFLIGEVMLEAEVTAAEAIERVEFFVDGQFAGAATESPYRVLADVGLENVEHQIRAVARGISGSQAEATVTTERIQTTREFAFDLQQLYITATRNEEQIADLRQQDFSIRDQGKVQKIVSFSRGEIPFTAVLLVDASQSMIGEKLESAQRGARDFADRMKPLDEVKLIVFSDRIRSISPFTSFSDILIAGLERESAVGGTAINDVLYLALSRLEERQGRRVVVLLSDGLDSHSALKMRYVLPSARRSRAIVYLIRTLTDKQAEHADVVPRANSPWRDQEGHRTEFRQLMDLVEESGGKVLNVASRQKSRKLSTRSSPNSGTTTSSATIPTIAAVMEAGTKSGSRWIARTSI